MPSFHPEICLTFADEQVSAVCARAMVMHQLAQAPVFTDSAQGAVSQGVFQDLVEQVKALGTGSQSVVIDGMPAEYLLFQHGVLTHRGSANASANASGGGDFSAMVRAAITAARDGIAGNAQARNALADASGYTGAALPHEPQALQKPKVVTMVLGPEDDRAQVMEALRRVNTGKK